MLKQLYTSLSVNSAMIFTSPLSVSVTILALLLNIPIFLELDNVGQLEEHRVTISKVLGSIHSLKNISYLP
jgi:hypothetical protein